MSLLIVWLLFLLPPNTSTRYPASLYSISSCVVAAATTSVASSTKTLNPNSAPNCSGNSALNRIPMFIKKAVVGANVMPLTDGPSAMTILSGSTLQVMEMLQFCSIEFL